MNAIYEFTTTAEEMHAIAMELNEIYDAMAIELNEIYDAMAMELNEIYAMREEVINHQEESLS